MAEGCAVMLFYQVGELFQSYAVGKSRKSIASMMDIAPDYANIERDGELVQVDPAEVAIGDVIVVKPGERAPIDGTVIEGTSQLDTSALTGESVPRHVEAGDGRHQRLREHDRRVARPHAKALRRVDCQPHP